MAYKCRRCGWEFLFHKDEQGRPKCPKCGEVERIEVVP